MFSAATMHCLYTLMSQPILGWFAALSVFGRFFFLPNMPTQIIYEERENWTQSCSVIAIRTTLVWWCYFSKNGLFGNITRGDIRLIWGFEIQAPSVVFLPSWLSIPVLGSEPNGQLSTVWMPVKRKLCYRQIHPGFCGSGRVWGPVLHHIPALCLQYLLYRCEHTG